MTEEAFAGLVSFIVFSKVSFFFPGMLSLLVGTVWALALFFFPPLQLGKALFLTVNIFFTQKNAQILIKSEDGSNETVARLWLQLLGQVGIIQ